MRHDIRVGLPDDVLCPTAAVCMPPQDLQRAVKKIYVIFEERTLKVIPSYVRKLIDSVIEIKGGFRPEYLDDSLQDSMNPIDGSVENLEKL
jgi:hypothetical protein